MNTMDPSAPVQRPTLLTIVCILSFIGGLWGAIDGIRTGFTNKAQDDLAEARAAIEEGMSQLQGQGGEFAQKLMEEGIVMTEKAAEHAKPMGIAALALSLLSLYGVWLMWNLRKQGFWYYTLAAVLGLVVPLYFLGFNMLAIMGLGFGAFVSILFIILYAVNLKHMH